MNNTHYSISCILSSVPLNEHGMVWYGTVGLYLVNAMKFGDRLLWNGGPTANRKSGGDVRHEALTERRVSTTSVRYGFTESYTTTRVTEGRSQGPHVSMTTYHNSLQLHSPIGSNSKVKNCKSTTRFPLLR